MVNQWAQFNWAWLLLLHFQLNTGVYIYWKFCARTETKSYLSGGASLARNWYTETSIDLHKMDMQTAIARYIVTMDALYCIADVALTCIYRRVQQPKQQQKQHRWVNTASNQPWTRQLIVQRFLNFNQKLVVWSSQLEKIARYLFN